MNKELTSEQEELSPEEEELLARKNRTYITNATKRLDAQEHALRPYLYLQLLIWLMKGQNQRKFKKSLRNKKHVCYYYCQFRPWAVMREYIEKFNAFELEKLRALRADQMRRLKEEIDQLTKDIGRRKQKIRALRNKIQMLMQHSSQNLKNDFHQIVDVSIYSIKLQPFINLDDFTHEAKAMNTSVMVYIIRKIGMAIGDAIAERVIFVCEIKDSIKYGIQAVLIEVTRQCYRFFAYPNRLGEHISDEAMIQIKLRNSEREYEMVEMNQAREGLENEEDKQVQRKLKVSCLVRQLDRDEHESDHMPPVSPLAAQGFFHDVHENKHGIEANNLFDDEEEDGEGEKEKQKQGEQHTQPYF